MLLKELITQGWLALNRNRLRSVLTMLGIVWGLASVVLLLAYGQGLGGSVIHAFMNMGNNVIVLWPGQTSLQAGGQGAGEPVTSEYQEGEELRVQATNVRAGRADVVGVFGVKEGQRGVSAHVQGEEKAHGENRRR